MLIGDVRLHVLINLKSAFNSSVVNPKLGKKVHKIITALASIILLLLKSRSG